MGIRTPAEVLRAAQAKARDKVPEGLRFIDSKLDELLAYVESMTDEERKDFAALINGKHADIVERIAAIEDDKRRDMATFAYVATKSGVFRCRK